ncbi:hypothetical protein HDU67_006594 [Dinochytrium kinnereticum]|nr:hypothetical protein HDU67_006594 [Dinochytrium kinnereticum]
MLSQMIPLLCGLLLSVSVVSAVPRKPSVQVGSSTPGQAASYVPTCGSKTPFAVFDPPVLQINDETFDVPFSVKLAKKPEGDVTVFLDGKGLSFERSTIVFTPANWNMPQKLHLMATPEFYEDQKSADVQILATVDAPCEAYAGCKQVYGGKRYKFPGGTCSISGDPHYNTFNGLKVTHMGKGVYSVIDSDYLSIQAYQYPCFVTKRSAPTCIGAVAIRYGESAAIVSVASKEDYENINLKKSGKPRLTRLSEDLEGMDYYPRDKVASDKWTFKLDDGSKISIDVGSTQGVSWLDVNVMLQAGYYGKVGGLCNVHDKKYGKQLLCSDGKAVGHKNGKDIDRWATSWKVADKDNMFLGSYKVGWKKWPLKNKYKPTKGCQATTFKTCAPKTTMTSAVTVPITSTTSTVVTLPVTTTTTTTITNVATSTSTTVVYVTTSSSVYASTSTHIYTTTTTSLAPVVTTTSTTTTVPVVETIITTTTEAAIVTTSTSTKTSCTIPPYKPTEYTYQTPAPTSTAAPVISTTTKTIGTSTIIMTTTAHLPSYTTVPKSPEYILEDEDEDEGYVIPIPEDYKPPTPKDISSAEQTCKTVMTIPGCEKICPNQISQSIHTCVTDVLSTSSYAFTENTRRTLASVCEAMSSYAVEGMNATVAAVAEDVRLSAGFGEYISCANDCSGRGVCEKGGCRCVSPFTGADCSMDKRALPAVAPISASAVGGDAAVSGTLVSNAGEVVIIKTAEYPEDPLPKVEETKPKVASTSTAAAAEPTKSAGVNFVQSGGLTVRDVGLTAMVGTVGALVGFLVI